MPYWGFDGKTHEGGKLVVNAEVAQDVADTFGKLYKNKFPIRKMVPVDVYKGDDFDSIEADNTSAFNCRPATGSSNWSRHAYGMAVDINPCENPYVSTSGEIAHPRCKKFYTDRSPAPGVITSGDKTVRAFEAIGWQWGGYWAGTKDFQHFDKR
ncbi:M15 family metallopeptidase [Actinocorallia herbida]|nr:M15 family metallopeptidase [Actinocorallia herbida]